MTPTRESAKVQHLNIVFLESYPILTILRSSLFILPGFCAVVLPFSLTFGSASGSVEKLELRLASEVMTKVPGERLTEVIYRKYWMKQETGRFPPQRF